MPPRMRAVSGPQTSNELVVWSSVISVLLFAAALATTTLWQDLGAALELARLPYAQARAMTAFNGLPIDEINARLDELLPGDAPVALGPELARSELLRQRLTEALYPRRIEPGAADRIDVVPKNTGAATARGTPLIVRDAFGRALTLALTRSTRTSPNDARPPARPPIDLSISLSAFVLGLIGACGLGLLALRALAGRESVAPNAILPAAALAGAVLIAIAMSAASWAQVALPRSTLAIIGVAGAIAAGLHRLRAGRPLAPGRWLTSLPPENIVLALYLGTVFFRFADAPISLWDGRSIWYFQAKRLVVHGKLAHADIADATTVWSHPDYPLLFPSWLAYFAGFGPAFNERMAALGNGALASATVALFWALARARIGRWPGAAVALAFALCVDHATLGGYADGLMATVLGCAFLAALDGSRAILFVTVAAAALTKSEGLPLAIAVVGPTLLIARKNKTASRSLAARSALALIPALVHAIWAKSFGTDSLLKGSSPLDALAAFASRLGREIEIAPAILDAPGYTHVRSALWLAAVAVAALVALSARTRTWPARTALAALAAAALAKIFALVAIALLPEDVEWFVGTALDRLLLVPAVLALLSPFLQLAATRTEPGGPR